MWNREVLWRRPTYSVTLCTALTSFCGETARSYICLGGIRSHTEVALATSRAVRGVLISSFCDQYLLYILCKRP